MHSVDLPKTAILYDAPVACLIITCPAEPRDGQVYLRRKTRWEERPPSLFILRYITQWRVDPTTGWVELVPFQASNQVTLFSTNTVGANRGAILQRDCDDTVRYGHQTYRSDPDVPAPRRISVMP